MPANSSCYGHHRCPSCLHFPLTLTCLCTLNVRPSNAGGGGGDTHAAVITTTPAEAKRLKRILKMNRKRKAKAEAALDKVSKKKLKKLAKLAERKAKESKRGELFAGLEEHQLSDAHHALLTKATSVGQRETKKQRAARHERLIAAGLLKPSERHSDDEDDDEDNSSPGDKGGVKNDNSSDKTVGDGLALPAASLDDAMGAIFSSRRQQAGQTSAAGANVVHGIVGPRAGDAKRAQKKIDNPPAARHQFGTSLAVPGFLNQFNSKEEEDAAKQPARELTEEEKEAVADAYVHIVSASPEIVRSTPTTDAFGRD